MTKPKKFNMYSGMEIPLCQNPQNILGMEELRRSGHAQVRLLVTNEVLGQRPLLTRETGPGKKPLLYYYPNMYLVFYVGAKSLKLNEYFEGRVNELGDVASAAQAYEDACTALETANTENEQYFQTLPGYEFLMISMEEVDGVTQAVTGRDYKNTRRKQSAARRGNQALRRLEQQRDVLIGNSRPPHSSDAIEALEKSAEETRRTYDALQERHNTPKNRRIWLAQYVAEEQYGVGLLRIPDQVSEGVIRTPHYEGAGPNRRWIESVPFYQLESRPHQLETNRLGIPQLGPEEDPGAFERLIFPYDVFLQAMQPERRNQFNIVDRRWAAWVPIAPNQPASSDILDSVPAILLTSLEVHEWALGISDELRQEILLNVDDLMSTIIDWHIDRNPLNPRLPRPTPLLTDGNPNAQGDAQAPAEGQPVEGAAEQGAPQGATTH